MPAPDKIAELAERYERNRDAYRSPGYNEAQVRQEFLDPFFECLGWDVRNKQGYAEAYKEVIHEDSIRVGGTTKAPDYCFRIGGTRKFFVEAKKPSVDIQVAIGGATQVRRYAWSAKLPISILTNFEGFAIYDCRIKPTQRQERAPTARRDYIPYTQYLDRWDEIALTFSKEAILKGSFDRYAASKRQGHIPVDEDFLNEMNDWRSHLAQDIFHNNPGISAEQLQDAVQKTIDRIVFLRICEDRQIEAFAQLKATNGSYKALGQIFQRADERYNSGLFHFSSERNNPGPVDTFTLDLKVSTGVLTKIIRNLYEPSRYEFSVFPHDLLGQVYEQFLGKVIVQHGKKQVRVEDKPEVRKAGGVYYTPSYIVDYIVKHTVGKLLEGKTPEQVAFLKVLDPACGSGSFLLGAYDELLKWHADWYVKDGPDRHPDKVYEAKKGEWRLPTGEKRRILVDNIFGVDIDQQAVEVSRLSLLLKLLEGENETTVDEFKRQHKRKALPDLARNITCGNSLIGPDFYETELARDLTKEELGRINAFDWNAEFPDIMKAGGFDAVIGNPPYGASFGLAEQQYYESSYSAFRGVKDVYPCFIERALRNLRGGGALSFIVPSAWLGGPEYVYLRKMLVNSRIDALVMLPFDVFRDAYIDTAIFVVVKQIPHSEHAVNTYVYDKHDAITTMETIESQYRRVRQSQWKSGEDSKFILDPGAMRILGELRKRNTATFGGVVAMKRGVLFDKTLLTADRGSSLAYLYFEGDVYRYEINLVASRWIEFDDRLAERPQESTWFEGDRILLRRLVNRRQRLMAVLVSEDFITNKNLYSIKAKRKNLNLEAVLGVLNSTIISYLYVNQVAQATKDDFPQVTIRDILALPFPDRLVGKPCHDRMVELVEEMLRLHKEAAKGVTAHEKDVIQRQIEATDRQIDALVYELYGLTDEEIRIVEEGTIRKAARSTASDNTQTILLPQT